MASLMAQVREAVVNKPDVENAELYKMFPNTADSTIRSYKSRVLSEIAPDRNMHRFEKFVISGAIPRTKQVFDFQKELFDICQEHDIIEIILPREHGKTWFLSHYIEYMLEVEQENVLLLSWTDIRRVTANRVYTYFHQKGLLDDSPGQQNSYMKFTLKNGASFYCDSITSRNVLGFHNYTIIVDDPLDITFREEPTKERKLELIWSSTMENINPNKLIISGTRKFQGDFFTFIDNMYGDEMFEYIRTPYLPDGSLLCPEVWTEERLDKKRKTIGEYMWNAEYMANPHPTEGGLWSADDIKWVYAPEDKFAYEWACISVDPARTKTDASDYTSINVVLKERGSLDYLVTNSITKRMEFEEILREIEQIYNFVKSAYLDIGVVVAIEKTGGGEYIKQSARSRGFNFAAAVKEVSASRDKKIRIESALEVPIREGMVKFLKQLEGSMLITQILTFPFCEFFDAIDSLSQGIVELENKQVASVSGWSFVV